MRVLVTGAGGQLASELIRTAPRDLEIVGLSRLECDISEANAVSAAVEELKPDVVINAAAYTAVDKAEHDRERAFAVNAAGAGNLARAAAQRGGRFIHVSTDYVFDGEARLPYSPEAHARPLNVYGATKLAGEIMALDAAPDALIVRSGWLYSSVGNNFFRTILAALRAGKPLRVVNDQVGVPTSARDLAKALWSCVARPQIKGRHHWVNAGSASWYEFAESIRDLALHKQLARNPSELTSIPTSEYPALAARPRYSVLDASDLWAALGEEPEHWRNALAATMDELKVTPVANP